jgi:hypothetical protein
MLGIALSSLAETVKRDLIGASETAKGDVGGHSYRFKSDAFPCQRSRDLMTWHLQDSPARAGHHQRASSTSTSLADPASRRPLMVKSFAVLSIASMFCLLSALNSRADEPYVLRHGVVCDTPEQLKLQLDGIGKEDFSVVPGCGSVVKPVLAVKVQLAPYSNALGTGMIYRFQTKELGTQFGIGDWQPATKSAEVRA